MRAKHAPDNTKKLTRRRRPTEIVSFPFSMVRSTKNILLCLAIGFVLAMVVARAGSACAQLLGLPETEFELDDTVVLDRADSTVLANLERAKAYVADGQWSEAIDTLQRVAETADDKLLGVTDHRFVGVRDFVNLQLANLPPEALELFRRRVDPMARGWFEEGVAKRDRRLLRRIVDEAFASSYGDEALMVLGEMALEAADPTTARWYWQRMVPSNAPVDVPRTWPGYPDSDRDLAAVRARLVLASILEGSFERAADELKEFARLHPDARGRFGGREVNYVEALRQLLSSAEKWPAEKPDDDWPTFAGSFQRNRTAGRLIDVGTVAWRSSLQSLGGAAAAAPGFHPAVVDDLVLVENSREVFAFRLADGSPAWGEDGPTIYRRQLLDLSDTLPQNPLSLGAIQQSCTVFGGRLYVRMGTASAQIPAALVGDMTVSDSGDFLLCLDLTAEGRLVWKVEPEVGWAFEGSPVVDGSCIYVGMCRHDVRPQAYVGCFDAQTGKQRWRRFICGAETPGAGVVSHSARQLLTRSGDTLYYNTNLGAVAALSTHDGRLRWVSLYPRTRRGDVRRLAPHWYRSANPCVYHCGTLLVAPADSPRIFSFDASTGQILWHTGEEVADALYLLGTTQRHLIAGGERLYWIELDGERRGQIVHVWPDAKQGAGFGRGILAGNHVLWPTREKVYVFDQQTAQPVKSIDLAARGVSGGNLLVAQGRLLIATETELIAMSLLAGETPEQAEPMPKLSWRGANSAEGTKPRAAAVAGIPRFLFPSSQPPVPSP